MPVFSRRWDAHADRLRPTGPPWRGLDPTQVDEPARRAGDGDQGGAASRGAVGRVDAGGWVRPQARSAGRRVPSAVRRVRAHHQGLSRQNRKKELAA
eukprot:2313948-Pyramimonas_sp.AAC.1